MLDHPKIMAQNPSKILNFLGYTVSVLTIVVGIAMIFGLLLSQIPGNYRILFGIVFLLYGIYRTVTIRLKQKKNYSDEN